MENDLKQKAQQALYEHLLRLKSIGEKHALSALDELRITEAITITFDKLSEEKGFYKSGNSNNE